MKTSEEGKKLIKYFEGLKDGDKSEPNYQPYLAPEGFWTVGYGHLIINPATKSPLSEYQKDIAYKLYPALNIEDIDNLFNCDIKLRENIVNSNFDNIPQSHFDVMVDLCFNLSSYNRLFKYYKQDIEIFKTKLLLYNKDINGKPLSGLVRRRKANLLLFENKVWKI